MDKKNLRKALKEKIKSLGERRVSNLTQVNKLEKFEESQNPNIYVNESSLDRKKRRKQKQKQIKDYKNGRMPQQNIEMTPEIQQQLMEQLMKKKNESVTEDLNTDKISNSELKELEELNKLNKSIDYKKDLNHRLKDLVCKMPENNSQIRFNLDDDNIDDSLLNKNEEPEYNLDISNISTDDINININNDITQNTIHKKSIDQQTADKINVTVNNIEKNEVKPLENTELNIINDLEKENIESPEEININLNESDKEHLGIEKGQYKLKSQKTIVNDLENM